jgi:GT2 family glycosyltransferase
MRTEDAVANPFDTAYTMGTFEDTDLCMRLLQQGRHFVYDPRSVLTHWEGTSMNSHPAGVSWVQHNRELFRSRWVRDGKIDLSWQPPKGDDDERNGPDSGEVSERLDRVGN